MQKGRPKGASFLHCVVETDLIASGSPTRPARWGEEESRREQEGDFKKKSPSASTADDDEVISSMKKASSLRVPFSLCCKIGFDIFGVSDALQFGVDTILSGIFIFHGQARDVTAIQSADAVGAAVTVDGCLRRLFEIVLLKVLITESVIGMDGCPHGVRLSEMCQTAEDVDQ